MILAFRKARQEDSEFKASLVSRISTGQSRLPGKTKQSQRRKKTKLSGEGGVGKKGLVFRPALSDGCCVPGHVVLDCPG